MKNKNFGVLHGKAGAPLAFALGIASLFLSIDYVPLTKKRLLSIKLLTFIILGCMVYVFSLLSQYIRFKNIIFDDNLVGVLIATIGFFAFGYGHFPKIKSNIDNMDFPNRY